MCVHVLMLPSQAQHCLPEMRPLGIHNSLAASSAKEGEEGERRKKEGKKEEGIKIALGSY